MSTFKKILISIGIGISVLFSGYQFTQIASASSFTPVQASQFTLSGAGITNTATTIQLTSFKLPDPSKTLITMAMFGDIGYAVIEPQTSRIENISFTGVTQNANGSATLTGVSRGLSFYTPYNATASLGLSHGGGAYLILTNSGAFYGKQFLFANNIGTSTAIMTFSSTTPPRYDSVGAQASGTFIATTSEFASITYVNKIAIAGCATGSSLVTGCVRLATSLQQASSTFSAGTPTVLNSQFSTSTPKTGCDATSIAGALCAVIAQNNGKIHQGFLDLTQSFNFTGALFASSTGNFIASSTQYVTNIGTLIASSTFKFTNTPTNMASSSILQADTTGNFTYGSPQFSYLNFPTVSAGASSTLAYFTLPGNSLGTNGFIEVDIPFSGFAHQQTNQDYFEMAYGNSTTTFSLPWTAGSGSKDGIVRVFLGANGATNAQKMTFDINAGLDGNNTTTETLNYNNSTTKSVDSTANKVLMVVIRTQGGVNFTASNVTAVLHRN